MTKPLTVRDIAEKAGVSLGTVSRVMNNAANIDPALKEHTLTVIRENNYIPLRRPRRNTRRSAAEGGRIAVLFCDMPHQWNESYFSRSYAAGIEAVCTAYRVETEFFTLQDLCGDTFFRRLAKFDGVLIKHNFGPGDPRAERINALAEKIPVAGFGTNFPHCRYSQTFLDNHSAGALAARELIGRGHRVIAFINPNPESEMLRSRGEGFREMMEQSGLWRPELFISRKLATVADDLVTGHRHALSRNRSVDDVADPLDVIMEIGKLASDARIERGIGRYTGKRAPARRFLDLVQISGIQKKLHLGPPLFRPQDIRRGKTRAFHNGVLIFEK